MMMLIAMVPPDRWEFIWASYAAFVVVFILLALAPIIRRKRVINDLKRYYRRQSLLNDNEQ
jgi:heme exporter protein CcmD